MDSIERDKATHCTDVSVEPIFSALTVSAQAPTVSADKHPIFSVKFLLQSLAQKIITFGNYDI